MKYLLGVVTMIWSLLSFGGDYPKVIVGDEEGFVDLTFEIEKVVKNSLLASEFQVKGNLKGKKVGFSIELLPNWKAQDVEGVDKPFYWGEAYFKSSGEDTKQFIIQLAELYGAKIDNINVPEKVHAQVVGLASNPGNVSLEPAKMKFFFNPDGDEEIYAEIYININVKNNILEFNEKDSSYRAPLLRSLLQ